MSDSRIEKLGRLAGLPTTHLTREIPDDEGAAILLEAIEVEGLLVVDPSDPAVIDRVVTTLEDRGFLAGSGTARAVLAALGESEKSTSDYDGGRPVPRIAEQRQRW